MNGKKNENVFSLVSLFIWKGVFEWSNSLKHWSKNLKAGTDVVKMEI